MLLALLLAFCYGAETLNGTSISLPDKPWPPEKPPETEGLLQERSLGRRAYYNADWLGTHGKACTPREVAWENALNEKTKYHIYNGRLYYYWVERGRMMQMDGRTFEKYHLGSYKRIQSYGTKGALVHYERGTNQGGCSRWSQLELSCGTRDEITDVEITGHCRFRFKATVRNCDLKTPLIKKIGSSSDKVESTRTIETCSPYKDHEDWEVNFSCTKSGMKLSYRITSQNIERNYDNAYVEYGSTTKTLTSTSFSKNWVYTNQRKMEVRFKSDGSVTRDGFKLEVGCRGLTTWTSWSCCSQSGKFRYDYRSRKCVDSDGENKNSIECGSGISKSQTRLHSGKWTNWSNWSTCSNICNGGISERSRRCIDSRQIILDDSQCSGSSTEKKVCNEHLCEWSEWATVGACSTTCGAGEQARFRECYSESNHVSESNCEGESEDAVVCNDFECPCPPGYTTVDVGETKRECRDDSGTGVNECDSIIDCGSNAACIDTTQGFSCQCADGFVLNGNQCENLDECINNKHECGENSICTDNIGSYACDCEPGYRGSGRGDCSDIDECNEEQDNCHQNAVCVNTHGSFFCECHQGYDGDGVSCSNINECLLGQDKCQNGQCVDTEGSYDCDCDTGYRAMFDTDNFNPYCDDMDECADSDNKVCHPLAKCTNTYGSFECSCGPGYTGDGFDCDDINECVNFDQHLCRDNSKCENFDGGYSCHCNAGFTYFDGDNEITPSISYKPTELFICNNIDECALGTDNCAGTAVCNDLEGSFECTCPSGFDLTPQGDDLTCTNVNECAEGDICESKGECIDTEGSYVCQCYEGYFVEDNRCLDIDECQHFWESGIDECGEKEICVNLEGSYECVCRDGYANLKGQCRDIDECITGQANDCHKDAVCKNIEGGYTCLCDLGFAGDGFTCTNINECEVANDCDENASCIDYDGGYSCACEEGFQGDGFECSDIDECYEGLDQCHENARCSNLFGSYFCECNEGFVGDGKECENINECENDPCPDENSHCADTVGSYICGCNVGFIKDFSSSTSSYECLDYDECDKGSHRCQRMGGLCTNTFGSYECECVGGWQGDGRTCSDIDECATGEHKCESNTKCKNLDGSYLCECEEGFVWYPDPADKTKTCSYIDPNDYKWSDIEVIFACKNVDECAAGTDDCSENASCSDSEGSFECTCNNGFTGDGKNCDNINECEDSPCQNGNCVDTVGSYACQCDDGYVNEDAVTCVNFDECAAGIDDCDSTATCTDTQGHYKCTCEEGYTANGVGCDDINECLGDEHQCDINADCRNTDGGYACICREGYMGPGKTCSDINECDLGLCENSDCVNNEGSYQCDCFDGFTNLDSVTCEDINECETETDNCDTNADCQNDQGSFSCVCHEGYTGNGVTCENIDECETDRCYVSAGRRKLTFGKCVDTEGSYRCDCNEGFTQKVKRGETIPTECEDIDECADGLANCHNDALCDNHFGSFKCHCHNGFTGDGVNCENINECAEGTDTCDENAECIDLVGYFDCECNEGYDGDGFQCSDLNECENETDNCDQNAYCINLDGSFDCVCKDGYNGSGVTCTNINECESEPCDNGECVDTEGSYTCECDRGYENQDQITCVNINECEVGGGYWGSCHEHAFCTDFEGSYTCECKQGYWGDGFDCNDVDECANDLDNNCDANANCINTEGGFTCQCIENFVGNGLTCRNSDECADASSCFANASCDTETGICSCKEGYRGNGVNCSNIDECEEESDNCDANASCTDTDGSFVCECNLGYNGDGVTCENVDECLTNPCVNGHCIDTEGSYECMCYSGYVSNGVYCSDIDECKTDNGGCRIGLEMCVNAEGGHSCLCVLGYERRSTDSECSNVNECLVPGNCPLHSVCTDTDGSFTCECESGFRTIEGSNNRLDYCEDRDECVEMNDLGSASNHRPCDINAFCSNTLGSYECICNEGWSGDGYSCVDADECFLGTDECDPNSTCDNLVGGYFCECNDYHVVGGEDTLYVGLVSTNYTNEDIRDKNARPTCTNVLNACVDDNCPHGSRCSLVENGVRSCMCRRGYYLDDGVCKNKNECDDNPCTNAECTDTDGSFYCECFTGYEFRVFSWGDTSERQCVDIDECTLGTNNCHSLSKCVNIIGSFDCECFDGYEGDGVDCQNIDECSTGANECDLNASCTDLDGSYGCDCKTGFVGNGFECSDLNECDSENPVCDENAFCLNTHGSYECTCRDGFMIDGDKCQNINECAEETDKCEDTAYCLDTVGSYECRCKRGFTKDENDNCVDFDECELGWDNCDVNASCTNTDGSFSCQCKTGFFGNGAVCKKAEDCSEGDCFDNASCVLQNENIVCMCNVGYEGDGFECRDADECALEIDDCGFGSRCSNTLGSFFCECTDGFEADGDDCKNIDECLNDPCENGMLCVDTVPGYHCECRTGFTMVDGNCVDIDECANSSSNKCQDYHICTNIEGGYLCVCDEGHYAIDPYEATAQPWEVDSNIELCRDIDECSEELDDCPENSTCFNLQGGYSCSCNPGFSGDESACNNINECEKLSVDCGHGKCVDTPGSYECECDSGYASPVNDPFVCFEVDECKSNPCSSLAICENTEGSFHCTCAPDFVGDGFVCEEVDENYGPVCSERETPIFGLVHFQLFKEGGITRYHDTPVADTFSADTKDGFSYRHLKEKSS